MLANMCVDTCKTIEADGSLHAGNPSRRLLDGARGSTLEVLGPSEGTIIATDGSNEVIVIGGGNDIVVVVPIGNGDKVVGGERHGLS